MLTLRPIYIALMISSILGLSACATSGKTGKLPEDFAWQPNTGSALLLIRTDYIAVNSFTVAPIDMQTRTFVRNAEGEIPLFKTVRGHHPPNLSSAIWHYAVELPPGDYAIVQRYQFYTIPDGKPRNFCLNEGALVVRAHAQAPVAVGLNGQRKVFQLVDGVKQEVNIAPQTDEELVAELRQSFAHFPGLTTNIQPAEKLARMRFAANSAACLPKQ